jgi:hypothetical protein
MSTSLIFGHYVYVPLSVVQQDVPIKVKYSGEAN